MYWQMSFNLIKLINVVSMAVTCYDNTEPLLLL